MPMSLQRQKAWPRKGSIRPPIQHDDHEKRDKTAMALSVRLEFNPSPAQPFLNTVR